MPRRPPVQVVSRDEWSREQWREFRRIVRLARLASGIGLIPEGYLYPFELPRGFGVWW
jgi:hypothetical protein